MNKHIHLEVIILITIPVSVYQATYNLLYGKIFEIIVKFNWTWIYMHYIHKIPTCKNTTVTLVSPGEKAIVFAFHIS